MPNLNSLLDNTRKLVEICAKFRIRQLEDGLIVEGPRPFFIYKTPDKDTIYMTLDVLNAVLIGLDIPHSDFTFIRRKVEALKVIIEVFRFMRKLKGGKIYEIDEEGNRTVIT